jgi:hypothetical protein
MAVIAYIPLADAQKQLRSLLSDAETESLK